MPLMFQRRPIGNREKMLFQTRRQHLMKQNRPPLKTVTHPMPGSCALIPCPMIKLWQKFIKKQNQPLQKRNEKQTNMKSVLENSYLKQFPILFADPADPVNNQKMPLQTHKHPCLYQMDEDQFQHAYTEEGL